MMKRVVTALFAALMLLLPGCAEKPEAPDSVLIPILMYHHIAEEGDGAVTISAETFREHMEALHDAGFNTILLSDLLDYVNDGKILPEKAVVITFDDGYESNYTYAYPILKELGMRATIFVIGVSVGHKEFYKDTEYRLTPHFDEAEMAEMAASGVMDIQTHTYDMHQWTPFESGDKVRESVEPLPGESEEEYIAAIRADFELAKSQIEAVTNKSVYAVSYPGGIHDEVSEDTYRQLGVLVTVTVEEELNEVRKHEPDTLYSLGRFWIRENCTPQELVKLCFGETD